MCLWHTCFLRHILVAMPKLPVSVGKYKIIDRLGRGGMSILYKAEHPSLGTPVVLKKLTLKGDPAYRERFRREATLMMKLRHENVVGVYDHFKEGSGHYLVMEYVDGRPLSELLAREGALPHQEAAWLAGRIAVALAHIHSQGIVHRDLKPSNVLLGRDGTVKLGDFGIAFTPGGGDDITSEGTALGTPTFMAPEQLEDARQADERSDMWSFGVCLFELLTGRKFVTGAGPAAIREALPGAVRNIPFRLPPKLPGNLRRLLRRTIRMRRDSRLRDGQAAVRLLGAARQSGKLPESLQARLDALLASMEPASEPTPKAETSPVGNADLETGTGGISDLRSLFLSSGIRTNRGGLRNQGKFMTFFKSRPLSLSLLLVLIFSLAVLLIIPGAWDAVFRRNSHGTLSLQLIFPEEAPDFWLTGVEARIYREGDESLYEVANPVLHLSREDTSMVSRRISLPVGAYRLRWSLGDKVSWYTFRLPSLKEYRTAGVGPLLLKETLGDPPSFPLELTWSAADALNGNDISGKTLMDWERDDLPGGNLVSGGRYRVRFSAQGYLPTSFAVAVSPWRRSLSLEASMWPLPARVTIHNDSERSVMPRLDGSGKILDMDGAPGIRRIGRLKPGETAELILLPGIYTLTPGFGNNVQLDLVLKSGDIAIIAVESGEDNKLLMRVLTE